jgi:hypothetical protein
VIREIPKADERLKGFAMCALKGKQSSLIVSPTHGEARRIAAAVWQELSAANYSTKDWS